MKITAQLKRLSRHIDRKRLKQLIILSILMLVGTLTELATVSSLIPVLTLIVHPKTISERVELQPLFEFLGLNSVPQMLIFAALTFCALVAFSSVFRLVLLWFQNKLAFGIGYDLSLSVFDRTLHRPYTYHVSKNTSEILAAVGKVQDVVAKVIQPLLQAFSAIALSTGILTALIIIDWKISLGVGGTLVMIYSAIIATVKLRLQRNSKVIAKTKSQRIKALRESLGGIRDILLDNSQSVFIKNYRKIDQKFRKNTVSNNVIAQAPKFIAEGLGMIVIVLFVLFTTINGSGGQSMIPVVGALALGAQRLLPKIQVIYFAWSKATGAQSSVEDVIEFLEEPLASHLCIPGTNSRRKQQPLEPLARNITFQNVCFSYHEGLPLVLRNVNIQIPKGSRVGIIGETGGGKSTFLDILMGLLQPTTGAVLVDGKMLDDEVLSAWQRKIAHVPQAIYLTDSAISTNIAFGIPQNRIDHDRVRWAAAKAQASTFIEALPEGYNTTVGDRGVKLSGGQRQRIGIARALYKKSEILILDEATSALDSETESRVIESIETLGNELTVFMIAHRVTTLRACDMVLRLANGKIASAGNYKSMIDEQTPQVM